MDANKLDELLGNLTQFLVTVCVAYKTVWCGVCFKFTLTSTEWSEPRYVGVFTFTGTKGTWPNFWKTAPHHNSLSSPLYTQTTQSTKCPPLGNCLNKTFWPLDFLMKIWLVTPENTSLLVYSGLAMPHLSVWRKLMTCLALLVHHKAEVGSHLQFPIREMPKGQSHLIFHFSIFRLL